MESEYREQFKNKFNIRLSSHENTSQVSDIAYIDFPKNVTNNYFLENHFEEILAKASLYNKINFYDREIPVKSASGTIEKFFKRCIRKTHLILFGWLLKPVIEEQTYFNEMIIESVKTLKKMYETAGFEI